MSDFILDTITESQALRKCLLPSTSRWRSFLRERLPHGSSGVGFIYRERDVDALAERISKIPAEVLPQEIPSTSTRATRPDRLSDRRGPAVN